MQNIFGYNQKQVSYYIDEMIKYGLISVYDLSYQFNAYYSKGLELNDRILAIAQELSLSEEAVKECLVLKNNYLSYSSLNAPVGDEEETELGMFLGILAIVLEIVVGIL